MHRRMISLCALALVSSISLAQDTPKADPPEDEPTPVRPGVPGQPSTPGAPGWDPNRAPGWRPPTTPGSPGMPGRQPGTTPGAPGWQPGEMPKMPEMPRIPDMPAKPKRLLTPEQTAAEVSEHLPKLDAFVGRGSITGQYVYGNAQVEISGEWHGQWVLDERFIQVAWTMNAGGNTSEYLIMYTYDPSVQEYESSWFGSDGSSASEHGTFQGDTLVLESIADWTNATTDNYRSTITFNSDGTYAFRDEFNVAGEWQPFMSMTFSRE